MVTLHVGGQRVGTLADAEKLIAEYLVKNHPIEFRNDRGDLVGTFLPKPHALPPEPLVPWDPSLTQADVDRALEGPFFTFEEMKKRLGWQ